MSESPSFDDLVEQFLERCRVGDVPDVKAFAGEYPEHSARLLDVLPVLLDMEHLGGGNKTQPIALQSPNLPDMAGTDYRLLKKIGSGGMGVVFEALQVSLNRQVAVKLLAPSFVADAAQREQFEQEARVIAMLHHPNIVQVLSAGHTDEACYYAMEFIDGKGLEHYRSTDLREIARIGLQAAQGLAYAHSCQVMHRDIKPANLLLDANGTIHISDFGLACVLQGGAEILEEGDSRSGTLRYMAPERLSQGVNTFLTDQYSLGATLYELVTQAPLLTEGTQDDLVARICREPVPPLTYAEPDLCAIINKSLSFNPADRYASMEEFAEDLRHFLNHEPVKAAAPSTLRRLSLWVRRKPALAALSLLSIACLAAFIVALAVGYIRTAAALKLAARNAATAHATLSSIFGHIEKQTPTASASVLLSTLMPYYQEIAQQRNLSDEQVAEANSIIGTAALRSGDYPLAETAFRRLSELRADAFPLNQLAESLKKQGRVQAAEADAISRQVVERYAQSSVPADRYEAVRALLSLSDNPESKERQQAFEMVKALLKASPGKPDYRFLYAVILGANPRLFPGERISGVEPNAVTLLNQLAGEYPEQPEYGLALVDLMNRKLRYARNFADRDWKDLDVALELSDQLLGRFPNTPQVVSSVVQFRTAHINALRRKGDMSTGRKETERLLGMLEILFNNPETPDAARECLVRMQLERLEQITATSRADTAERLATTIRNELKIYKGVQSHEFQQSLIRLTAEATAKPQEK